MSPVRHKILGTLRGILDMTTTRSGTSRLILSFLFPSILIVSDSLITYGLVTLDKTHEVCIIG